MGHSSPIILFWSSPGFEHLITPSSLMELLSCACPFTRYANTVSLAGNLIILYMKPDTELVVTLE